MTSQWLNSLKIKQLSLAVAPANNPEILLADEPKEELDSVTTLKIIEYLKELNSDLGITIIVLTHDHRFARIINKVLKIQDGRFSGFFTSKKELSFSDSEKLTYIDKFGTLIIPEYFRKAAHINNYVRFEIVDGKLVVLPANSDNREGIN